MSILDGNVPQSVVYNPSYKYKRNPIAHWLKPDGRTTFCGHDIKRNVGWEPCDGSPHRMCGRCTRSGRRTAPNQ